MIAKLGDFGIAKDQIDKTSSKAVSIAGTAPYMAPEKFLGLKYGRAADIWAIGLVLYEMLSGGKKAFDDDDYLVLYHKITNRDPDPLPIFVDKGID